MFQRLDCLRLQVKHTQLEQIDRASLYYQRIGDRGHRDENRNDERQQRKEISNPNKEYDIKGSK
jgi:hypothetical protein